MTISPSATSAGKTEARAPAAPRPGGSTVRQR